MIANYYIEPHKAMYPPSPVDAVPSGVMHRVHQSTFNIYTLTRTCLCDMHATPDAPCLP